MIFVIIFFYTVIIYYTVTLFIIYKSLQNKLNYNINNDLLSVSIIVAVRNGDKSLLSLLNLLSNQTYKGKIEFIIVDDNSIDNTGNIIKDFCKIDTRFIYVHSKIVYNIKIF